MEPDVVNIPGIAQTNNVLGLHLQERDGERLPAPLPHIKIVLLPTNNAPNNMVPAMPWRAGPNDFLGRIWPAGRTFPTPGLVGHGNP